MNASMLPVGVIPQLSLAAFPGVRYQAAMDLMSEPVHERQLGQLGTAHVQIVPQLCRERLTDGIVEAMLARFAGTQFRLHANVRVSEKHLLRADLSTAHFYADYFRELARLSRLMGAPSYTAHAGRREYGSFVDVLDNSRRLADVFGCPVGIEGHYPTPREPNANHVDSWQGYRDVFESDAPYVLDMSHLNIVATFERRQESTMVAEMLACERCIEVHLSANDGRGDQHDVLDCEPWWWSQLRHIHRDAVVFSEGNQLRKSRLPARAATQTKACSENTPQEYQCNY